MRSWSSPAGRRTLRPDSAKRSRTTGSGFGRVSRITATVQARAGDSRPFTACSRRVHDPVTGARAQGSTLGRMSPNGSVLSVGALEIRPDEHQAVAAGHTLALSVRELELLAALARREGRIVPRSELYETVWAAPLREGRPLRRRLRPQAAREARPRTAGLAPHPHPLRFRLPLRAGAFTPFSQRGHSLVTGSRSTAASLADMRNHHFFIAMLSIAALGLGVAACGGDSGKSSGSSSSGSSKSLSGTINGAGATFPLPVYQEWAARLKDQDGLTVNYQGIGSGGGISQFTAGTVDFGATDSAMEDSEVKAAEKKGQPVHIPSVFGAVTVSYNVQGVDKGLKLDGKTVADIFLGNIK